MRIGIEAQRIFRRKKHGMDMVALIKKQNQNQFYAFTLPPGYTSRLGLFD
ncbi:MAG TPA: hypothetical protein PK915_11410 [Bacteroidales bacterium]|nr:hypothetical protein [Bacteroidales bacterium]